MMHRAQILIENWQYEVLKALAERHGSSISEIVREILNDRLGRDHVDPQHHLAQIRGIGSDSRATGRDHDAYLYGPARREK